MVRVHTVLCLTTTFVWETTSPERPIETTFDSQDDAQGVDLRADQAASLEIQWYEDRRGDLTWPRVAVIDVDGAEMAHDEVVEWIKTAHDWWCIPFLLI